LSNPKLLRKYEQLTDDEKEYLVENIKQISIRKPPKQRGETRRKRANSRKADRELIEAYESETESDDSDSDSEAVPTQRVTRSKKQNLGEGLPYNGKIPKLRKRPLSDVSNDYRDAKIRMLESRLAAVEALLENRQQPVIDPRLLEQQQLERLDEENAKVTEQDTDSQVDKSVHEDSVTEDPALFSFTEENDEDPQSFEKEYDFVGFTMRSCRKI
jgi:hypothetical protein